MIDDDDFVFDDGPDDEELAAIERPVLIIPARVPTSEMLNVLEERFRMFGHPPVLFVAVDDITGAEILENRDEFARQMGLPLDTPISPDQAMAWIDRERAAGRWRCEWEW